ncbi:PilT protein domain protein [Calothrix sp. NIES-4071]|nr:PilT protein domain protein [Calothrix sp. NIES-4071]BAZ59904.1 PilT protein domain protein [Calothrix sp. NIES-4105]
MYILDTDHLSILDRGGAEAQGLRLRLANINPNQVAATIISYEEQIRGWLSKIAKVKTIEEQVECYKKLHRQLTNYCAIPVIEFEQEAAQEFKRLKKLYPRLGTMDLKIASISLVNKAILLTRNSSDFGQIVDLNIDNWI